MKTNVIPPELEWVMDVFDELFHDDKIDLLEWIHAVDSLKNGFEE